MVHCIGFVRSIIKQWCGVKFISFNEKDYSYNTNQQDALFLKFILVKNSTRFGQIYSPSSGVLILYSQQ